MATGDIISASDYNTIQTKIQNVMGTGSGGLGYGQPVNSSQVAAGNQVTKAQWDALRYDIYNALLHQTGSGPTITTINVGDVVRYGAANPNFQYNTLADTATTNKFNIGSGQFLTQVLQTTSRTSSWSTSVSTTATVTFNTAEQARFFFNSGGKIRLTSSRSGGSSSSQNNSWSNVLSSAGTQALGASGTTVNFYNLTSSYQTFYLVSSSSPYSANTYRIEVSCNVANNSSGTANILNFRVTWSDAYRDPDALAGRPESLNPPTDVVDGTLTLTMDQLRASGSLQPSGTFTITGPASSTLNSISGS